MTMLEWLLGLRNRAKSARPANRNRLRLAVEGLEPRWCPAGPQITSLNAAIVQGDTVMLSGTVSDPGADSLSVSFQGDVTGTAAVSNGSFSLQTQASQLGTIYAQASDNLNNFSTPVQTQLSASPPAITAGITENGGTSVTISGTVTDGSPAGLTVSFSGEVTGSATTDANGNYSFTANAAAPGTISVQTKDVWGLLSNTSSVMIVDVAPSITLSVSQDGNHTVTVSGQVTSQAPGGLTVTLSGVVEGTATTSPTGAFSYTGTASNLGQIYAQVADVWGMTGYGSIEFTNTPPSISGFMANLNSSTDAWTFSGQVCDEYAAGLTVTLSNIPGEGNITVTGGSQGFFTYTTILPAGASGTVTATVTDWWGATSQPVTVTI